MKINQYDVFNSNASKANSAVLRIKLDRVILAEVRTDHSDPLKFVRTHPLSEERASFVNQLTLCGVSAEDVAMLLKLPPKVQS